MTPEAQRIAIAEACPEVFRVIHGKVYWKNDDGLCDPLNDLNAMHEAEKLVTDWRRYSDRLMRIVQAADITLYSDSVGARYRTAGATAAQKAEAFLKAIGKWKELEP